MVYCNESTKWELHVIGNQLKHDRQSVFLGAVHCYVFLQRWVYHERQCHSVLHKSRNTNRNRHLLIPCSNVQPTYVCSDIQSGMVWRGTTEPQIWQTFESAWQYSVTQYQKFNKMPICLSSLSKEYVFPLQMLNWILVARLPKHKSTKNSRKRWFISVYPVAYAKNNDFNVVLKLLYLFLTDVFSSPSIMDHTFVTK